VVLAVVEVDPWVLPAVADAGVGGESTTTADAGADDAATDEVGRWDHNATPSGTLERHYRIELP
jgi:hypothetical protein